MEIANKYTVTVSHSGETQVVTGITVFGNKEKLDALPTPMSTLLAHTYGWNALRYAMCLESLNVVINVESADGKDNHSSTYVSGGDYKGHTLISATEQAVSAGLMLAAKTSDPATVAGYRYVSLLSKVNMLPILPTQLRVPLHLSDCEAEALALQYTHRKLGIKGDFLCIIDGRIKLTPANEKLMKSPAVTGAYEEAVAATHSQELVLI